MTSVPQNLNGRGSQLRFAGSNVMENSNNFTLNSISPKRVGRHDSNPTALKNLTYGSHVQLPQLKNQSQLNNILVGQSDLGVKADTSVALPNGSLNRLNSNSVLHTHEDQGSPYDGQQIQTSLVSRQMNPSQVTKINKKKNFDYYGRMLTSDSPQNKIPNHPLGN